MSRSDRSKKGKKETSNDTSIKEIETLLKTRFHGAVNIRGIQYQILYSILSAFDLYKYQDVTVSLRLEGLEDLDLIGMRLGNEYIQAKSSQSPWNWAKLKEPVKGFLDIHRAESQCSFLLVVNFQLEKDIYKFAHRESLSQRERHLIEDKFNNLCRQIGASSIESAAIASRLTITSKPEELVCKELRQNFVNTFGVGSEAVDMGVKQSIYISQHSLPNSSIGQKTERP